MTASAEGDRELAERGFAAVRQSGVQYWVVRHWQDAGIFHGFAGADLDLLAGTDKWHGCFPGRRLALLNQVHGVEFVEVAAAAEVDGYFEAAERAQRPAADGWLVTSSASLDSRSAFGILTADCFPVLAAAPAAGMFAALHCGWRSAVGGLLPRTLAAMFARGVGAADVEVAVGPGAQATAYEVGEEVAAMFLVAAERAQGGSCLPEERNPGFGRNVIRKSGAALFADIGALLRLQAIASGISPQQFYEHPFCSILNKNFFSHRRQKGLSGRQVSFIAPLRSGQKSFNS